MIPIHALVVEDSPNDASLLVHELQNAGFDPKWTRVENEAEYRAALASRPDIIFSDFSLPRFSGSRALEVLHENQLDIPFILISGTIGEERAVESLKAGATDYLLKGKLERLGTSVSRALRETRERMDRKRAEELVRLQANALEAAANGIIITDRDGKILAANSAFYAMTSYTSDEVLGENPRFLKSGRHDPAFYRELWRTILTGEVWHGEMINRRKDGTLFQEEMTITPVRRNRGAEITHFIAVKQDITSRKRTEEELRASEERYRALINEAEDSIFTLSRTGEITSLNPAFEKITGWKPTDWIGRYFAPMIHPDDLPQALSLFDRVIHGEKPPSFELRVADSKGSHVTLEFKTTPKIHHGVIAGVLGIGRDATQRKELEAQLQQAQKMESIGQLAGGIAHDFNNILTIIQGHASLVENSEKLSPEAAESIREICLASEHAAGLTRQLLTFSRRQVIQRRDLDLDEVVVGVTKMLQRVLGEDIALQFEPTAELPPISADAGMIEQVLMNLAVNARDAMPKGGRLIIRTSIESIDEEMVRHNPEATVGKFVCLAMTDTGCGISPDNLSRIFEPFFTTKEVGKGTGLGLATAYGIVKQHQGWIRTESELNRGTTFRIYFPTQVRPDGVHKPKPRTDKIRGGTETILLAEDETALRLLVRNVLEAYGYTILESSSALEALDLWRQHHATIDLLLTDLVMPGGVSGRELADKVREQNPKLRVIFMSGYSAEILGKDFTLREGINFLQKPYHPRKLAQCVRDCLDSSKIC